MSSFPLSFLFRILSLSLYLSFSFFFLSLSLSFDLERQQWRWRVRMLLAAIRRLLRAAPLKRRSRARARERVLTWRATTTRGAELASRVYVFYLYFPSFVLLVTFVSSDCLIFCIFQKFLSTLLQVPRFVCRSPTLSWNHSIFSLSFYLAYKRSNSYLVQRAKGAMRYSPKELTRCFIPPLFPLAFYNAFLPVFVHLHFCTRAHIALARVFLENRGLLLWGRPTDGLRNRRCSLTVCRGASAAPPSRLVLPPCCLPPVPLSTVSLYPRPPPSVSSCVFCVPRSSLSLSLAVSLALIRRASILVSTDILS